MHAHACVQFGLYLHGRLLVPLHHMKVSFSVSVVFLHLQCYAEFICGGWLAFRLGGGRVVACFKITGLYTCIPSPGSFMLKDGTHI